MVSGTLIADMKQLCSRYSLGFVEPNWDLIVGVSDNIMSGAMPVHGLRHRQVKGTLGWYIYAGDTFPQEENAFAPVCAVHLAQKNSHWVKYLALPEGWRFITDQVGYEDVWYDSGLLEAKQ